MKISLSTTLTLLALLGSGFAHAVPCGTYSTYGGVLQATDCRNSPIGDATDTASDLNDGTYFDHNDWQLLTRTGEGDPNSANYWTVSSGGTGALTGTLELATGIWDQFLSLAVVLKDGGSWHNRDYKWAAYLLPTDFLGTFNWSYDGGHKNVSHMTLYGVRAPRQVPEPASLALVLTGLVGMSALALRRHRSV